MRVTLLISTYNRPDALDLVLKSVLRQSVMPNEIVIADDGSTQSTKSLIDMYREKFRIPVIHIWHEDKGFRRTVILNRAFLQASGDYIIQVDGDLILNRNFIKDHISFAQKNSFTKGRRVCLSITKTEQLLKQKSIDVSIFSKGTTMREHGIRIPYFNQIFKPKEKASADGIGGGNMAYWLDDAKKVNGYNNNIQGWGMEDWEFAQRLVYLGNTQRKLKFGAVQFHLEHNTYQRKVTQEHLEIEKQIKKHKIICCENGLEQVQKLNEKYEIYAK